MAFISTPYLANGSTNQRSTAKLGKGAGLSTSHRHYRRAYSEVRPYIKSTSGTTPPPAKLAIERGPKAFTRPFPPRHLYGQEEKPAVIALFDQALEAGEGIGDDDEHEQA